MAGIGFADTFRKDYDTALEWLQRSLATFNEWTPTYWSLGAVYAHLGRMDEARATVRRLLELAPHSNLAEMQRLSDRTAGGRMQGSVEGLRMARLPEH